jgi:hypothetical protein
MYRCIGELVSIKIVILGYCYQLQKAFADHKFRFAQFCYEFFISHDRVSDIKWYHYEANAIGESFICCY